MTKKQQRAQLIKKYKFNSREDWQRAMDDLWAKVKKDAEEWSAGVKEKMRVDELEYRKELKKKYPRIFHMY
jgi:hypothetical protein